MDLHKIFSLDVLQQPSFDQQQRYIWQELNKTNSTVNNPQKVFCLYYSAELLAENQKLRMAYSQ